MSDNEDNQNETIVLNFNAEKGQIINARQLLMDEGFIDDNQHKKSSKMSNILAKVQSKMGTVCPGYDEGDNFIDDSEIINNTNVAVLDPNAFRVVISYAPQNKQSQATKSKSDESLSEKQNVQVPEELAPFIDAIRHATFAPINEQMEKIHSGTSKEKEHKITLTNDMVDAIGRCIDEKVRIETEKLEAPPSKKKVDGWRRDICNLIYLVCFTVKDYTFISSTRVLQNAYKKYLERKDPKPPQKQEDNENKETEDSMKETLASNV